MEALLEPTRRKPNRKNRVDEATEAAVCEMALEQPACGQVRERHGGSQRPEIPSIRSHCRRRELCGMLAASALGLAVFDDDGAALVAGDEPASGAVFQCPGASATLRDIDLARRWIADDGRGDVAALHERQVHAVQRDSGCIVPRPADGIDEPVGRAIGRRLASTLLADHRKAKGVVHDASHRVLDGDIRRRHHIARAFGADVLGADATPSQLERSLDRAHGDHGFATEPFSERRHRCLEVLSREIEAAHAKILPRTISEGQSGTLSRMVDN